MNNAHKSVTALVALGAVLVMPLAFAQTQSGSAMSSDPAAQGQTAPTQSTTPTDPAASQAAPAADAKKVTWADLDGDKDGKLTKTEAAPLPSLTQIFDQADSNADGSLTADEYKAYIAKNGNAPGGNQG